MRPLLSALALLVALVKTAPASAESAPSGAALAPLARPTAAAQQTPETPPPGIAGHVPSEPPPGRAAGRVGRGDLGPRRLAAIEQRLVELEARARNAEVRATNAERTAAALREAPSVGADDRGFVLRSADGGYALKIRGLAAFDGRKYFGDPSLVDSDGFLVRRIRPIAEMGAGSLVDLRLQLDFAESRVTILDAYADIAPASWLKFRVGKFTPPVGLERAQGDADSPFLERSLVNNLVASRDVGVVVRLELPRGFVHLVAGLLDGAPDGGMVDLDSNQGKDIAGRFWLRPLRLFDGARGSELLFGISGSTGRRKGQPLRDRTGLATLRSAGQTAFFSYGTSDADAAAITFADGRHSRVNPQFCLFVGPFGLLAEGNVTWQRVRRGPEVARLRHLGWNATASFVLGGRATLAGAAPGPFAWDRGALGALEIAVRYGEIVFDRETFPTFADSTRSARVGRALGTALSWYLGRNLRLALDFQQTAYVSSARGPGLQRTGERVLLARTQVTF